MKALYTLLFVVFIQTCLNSSEDIYISIPEDNRLTKLDCQSDKYYGFAFLATTSGFREGSYFRFFSDAPGYFLFDCDVPESNGKLQTISCWGIAEIFPLLNTTNVVFLPNDLRLENIKIEGWQYLRKDLLFEFCSPLKPTNTFIIKGPFTTSCDNIGNNIISTSGEFLRNLEEKNFFLRSTRSTDEDYITYTFEPILLVDGKLAKAICYIYVFNFEDEEDEQLHCLVDGKESGQFFDTVATSNIKDGPNQKVVRMLPSKPFHLKDCE